MIALISLILIGIEGLCGMSRQACLVGGIYLSALGVI